jgi:tetratricopeptide (TPR) repeat protein
MSKGQLEEAAESFERSTELFPDNGEFRLFHAIVLTALKKYDYAIVELERARGAMGEGKAYLYHLGRIKYETGNLSEAVELWEKALALEPDDTPLRSLVEKTRRELAVEDKMVKGYSGRFNLSYDVAAKNAFADDILSVLEEAYNRVGSNLNHYPEARVPVLIYTRKGFKDITKGPEWSGGVYDGKIRLPIGGLAEISPMVRSVLYHEYAHVVVFELTRGNVPNWLNEGIAEYFGRSQVDEIKVPESHKVKHNASLTINQLEKSFTTLSTNEAITAYDESYALLNFIVQAYGWHKVNDLLRTLGRGLPIEQAVAETFRDYSLDYPAILAEWNSYRLKERAR